MTTLTLCGDTPRQYAENLLRANLGKTLEQTHRLALIGCINASRMFSDVPAAYWADVASQIEWLVGQSILEADAAAEGL